MFKAQTVFNRIKPYGLSEINYGHRLTRGLRHCFLFNEKSGKGGWIDLATKRKFFQSTYVNNSTSYGMFVGSFANRLVIPTTYNVTTVDGPITISLECTPAGAPFESQPLYAGYNVGSGSGAFYIRLNTNGTLEFLSSNVVSIYTVASRTGFAHFRTIRVTFTLGRGGKCTFYDFDTELPSGSNSDTFTNDVPVIGAETDSDNEGNAWFNYFYIWDRALTSAEAREVGRNPYAMIY